MNLGWNFYFSLICSIGGMIFFIYSLYIIKKIRELFPGAKLIKKWIIIQSLIILFLAGYIFNIVFLVLESIVLVTFMTAIVYIFGAFFVAIVINLAYKTYKLILLESASKKEK